MRTTSRYVIALAAAALIHGLCGCGEPAAEPGGPGALAGPANVPPGTPPSAPAEPSPASSPAGSPAVPVADLPETWAKRVAETDALNEKLEAKPGDAVLKKQAVAKNFELGHDFMIDSKNELAPRVKYRTALKYLRRAVALAPDHKEAAADIKQIEDIYKMMGRPVPE